MFSLFFHQLLNLVILLHHRSLKILELLLQNNQGMLQLVLVLKINIKLLQMKIVHFIRKGLTVIAGFSSCPILVDSIPRVGSFPDIDLLPLAGIDIEPIRHLLSTSTRFTKTKLKKDAMKLVLYSTH